MISGTSSDWLTQSEFKNRDCMERIDGEDFDEIDSGVWWQYHDI